VRSPPDNLSWFGPTSLESVGEQVGHPGEFERLWRGFMTARVTLGLVFLGLQGTIFALDAGRDSALVFFCAAYFLATLAVRLLGNPQKLGQRISAQWLATIGVDVMAFVVMQLAQGGSINYAPLFALPVLMASVLGSLLMGLGVAASVTLLMFVHALWSTLHGLGDGASLFFQAALTGTGCFVMALLAHQIATRMANVELRAQRSQLATRVQRQVNELVIEFLNDGVLVVDRNSAVRAANPASRQMLGAESTLKGPLFSLNAVMGWHGLDDLMKQSFADNSAHQADITIHHAGRGPRRVQVRTRLTPAQDGGATSERLCVMFLQDQREIEARMRTEKMASMGRMSAAVAHEIRNPLSAIAQANALLDEDLAGSRHQQLTQMIRQNVKRLDKIVDEVLNISRVQHFDNTQAKTVITLNTAVRKICDDWEAQTDSGLLLHLDLQAQRIEVRFEEEHLRQVLVNLLDNAKRYASHQVDSIQISAGTNHQGQAVMSVWSDGLIMDQSVERHLFEPFFSSESRSSGLGLYICRELCERHGASIAYYRTPRTARAKTIEGNEFIIHFKAKALHASNPMAAMDSALNSWPLTQH
jgi:two-component system, NtrC family, sensor histidine kinase PilS